MPLQLSTPIRNTRLDDIQAGIGPSALLRFYSGAPPANCAAAPTGTLLAAGALPASWMTPAAGGQKVQDGVWAATGLVGGTIGYFRIYNAGGTVCGLQGTVTPVGGGGDMALPSITVLVGQPYGPAVPNPFTLIDGSA